MAFSDRLIAAVEQVESGGREDAVSPVGARGPMQVMPRTGQDPGFGVSPLRDDSPEENRRLGRDYLNAMQDRFGSPQLALVAYNWGPGNTEQWLARGADPSELPQETVDYIRKVNALAPINAERPSAPQEAPGYAPSAPEPTPFPEASSYDAQLRRSAPQMEPAPRVSVRELRRTPDRPAAPGAPPGYQAEEAPLPGVPRAGFQPPQPPMDRRMVMSNPGVDPQLVDRSPMTLADRLASMGYQPQQQSLQDRLASMGYQPPAAEEPSAVGSFARGVGGGFARAFTGSARGLTLLADTALDAFGFEDAIRDDGSVYSALDEADKAIFEALPTDDSTASTVGQALGSMMSFFVPGAAVMRSASVAGRLAGRAGTTGLAVGLGTDEQQARIEAYRAQGGVVSDSDERMARILGGVIGLSELLPMERLFRYIPKNIKKTDEPLVREAANRIASITIQAGAEGGQEAIATILQDLAEKGIYNEDLRVGDSALEAYATGGAAGGLMAIITEVGTAVGRRARAANATNEARTALEQDIAAERAQIAQAERINAERGSNLPVDRARLEALEAELASLGVKPADPLVSRPETETRVSEPGQVENPAAEAARLRGAQARENLANNGYTPFYEDPEARAEQARQRQADARSRAQGERDPATGELMARPEGARISEEFTPPGGAIPQDQRPRLERGIGQPDPDFTVGRAGDTVQGRPGPTSPLRREPQDEGQAPGPRQQAPARPIDDARYLGVDPRADFMVGPEGTAFEGVAPGASSRLEDRPRDPRFSPSAQRGDEPRASTVRRDEAPAQEAPPQRDPLLLGQDPRADFMVGPEGVAFEGVRRGDASRLGDRPRTGGYNPFAAQQDEGQPRVVGRSDSLIDMAPAATTGEISGFDAQGNPQYAAREDGPVEVITGFRRDGSPIYRRYVAPRSMDRRVEAINDMRALTEQSDADVSVDFGRTKFNEVKLSLKGTKIPGTVRENGDQVSLDLTQAQADSLIAAIDKKLPKASKKQERLLNNMKKAIQAQMDKGILWSRQNVDMGGPYPYAGSITTAPTVESLRLVTPGVPGSLAFTNGPVIESNGYRGETIPEFARSEMAAAMEDLQALGMSLSVFDGQINQGMVLFTVESTDISTLGYYDYNQGLVGVNKRLLENLTADLIPGRESEAYRTKLRAVIRSTIAHEVGHAVDRALGRSTKFGISEQLINSQLGFQIRQIEGGSTMMAGKPIFNELYRHYQSRGEFSQFFGYPLDNLSEIRDRSLELGAQPSSKDQTFIARELFAQAHALYHTNRDQMRELLPLTYQMMEDAVRSLPPTPPTGGRNGRNDNGGVRGNGPAPLRNESVQADVRSRSPFGRAEDGGADGQPGEAGGNGAQPPGGREAQSPMGEGDEPLLSRNSSGTPGLTGEVPYELAREQGTTLSGQPSTNRYNLDDDARTRAWSFRTLRRKLSDKFLEVKEVEKTIASIEGMPAIPINLSTYYAEERMQGQLAEDMRKLEKDYVEVVAKELSARGLTLDDLDAYLYAKHAPERNAVIAAKRQEEIDRYNAAIEAGQTRNEPPPPMPDGGSGMTNAEAAQILREAEAQGKTADLDAVASKVYQMLEVNRNRLIEAGLLDADTVNGWTETYQFYVPLKGFQGEDNAPIARTGRGFSIGGKEVIPAAGRSSKAASPFTNAILDSSEKIVRARKNEVAQTFLAMVQTYPDRSNWEVFREGDGPFVVEADPVSGRPVQRRENMKNATRSNGDPKYFMVKQNGETLYVEIKDELLNRAMHNAGVEQFNGMSKLVVDHIGKATRFLSMVNTTLNPEFALVNPIRDIQAGIMNLFAEQDLPDGKVRGENIVKDTIRDLKASRAAFARGLKGKQGTTAEQQEFDQFYQDFVDDGAKTGWAQQKSFEEQRKDIENLAAIAGNKNLWYRAKGAGKAMIEVIENINLSLENAARLSAYINARKAGVDRMQAASLAKNLTINFNRRGEATTVVNSLFMFFNAAVQGNAQLIRSVVSDPRKVGGLTRAQKMAGSMVAMGVLSSLYNDDMSDEDEAGETYYSRLEDWKKSRNMVFMRDGENHISIPLPYGYNIFYVAGVAMGDVFTGQKPPGYAATLFLRSVFDSFSPLGLSGDKDAGTQALKAVTPTVVLPAVELATNSNHFGSPIYRENFPMGAQKPDSAMPMRNTTEVSKAIAEFFNAATGGTQRVSGGIDFSPDSLDYLVGYAAGGLGRFAGRTMNLANVLGDGIQEEDYREIPFVRQVLGAPSNYAVVDRYYSHKFDIEQYVKELDSRRGADRAEWIKRHGDVVRLGPLLKNTEKQLKTLREQRRNLEAFGGEGADERLDRIEDRITAQYQRLNAAWNRVREPEE